MFSRTWLAVLAGSVVLWGMGQLGGGGSFPDLDPGGLAIPAPVSPAAAAASASGLAACLEEAGSLDASASSASGAQDASLVERRYHERCRPLIRGAAFDAFAVVYGERSRAAVAAIVDREARLAAELAAGPQAGALDPDVVWAAALRRAASDVRGFEAELAAWFDARLASVGAGSVVVSADPAGRMP